MIRYLFAGIVNTTLCQLRLWNCCRAMAIRPRIGGGGLWALGYVIAPAEYVIAVSVIFVHPLHPGDADACCRHGAVPVSETSRAYDAHYQIASAPVGRLRKESSKLSAVVPGRN
jgi:hypothetical protein